MAPRAITSSRFTVEGALFGFDRPLKAVSSGQWLVMKLPAGTHTVTTFGQSSDGFTSETTYTFTAN